MKPRLRIVAPATENRTVTPRRRPNAEIRTREYLTETEVEKLIKAAGKNRWGHRDATMILVAYRHGLRACELVDLRWDQIDFNRATLAVRRVKSGTPATHPIRGDELRALRRLQREQDPRSPSCSPPSEARRSPRAASPGLWSALARPPGSASRRTRTCSGTPAASPWPTRATIPGRCRLSRAQEYPAYGAIHRAFAGSVQGFLEELTMKLPFCVACLAKQDRSQSRSGNGARGRSGNGA